MAETTNIEAKVRAAADCGGAETDSCCEKSDEAAEEKVTPTPDNLSRAELVKAYRAEVIALRDTGHWLDRALAIFLMRLAKRIERPAQAEGAERRCRVFNCGAVDGEIDRCTTSDCPSKPAPTDEAAPTQPIEAMAKAAYECRHACHGRVVKWEKLDQRDQAAERAAIRAALAVQPSLGPSIADLKPGQWLNADPDDGYSLVQGFAIINDDDKSVQISRKIVKSWPAGGKE